MAERHLRGSRMSGSHLQREDGVALADRVSVDYLCGHCGREQRVVFAADADVPTHWQCRGCAEQSTRVGHHDSDGADAGRIESPGGRTPWEMLLERRSIPELEEILQERLDWLRARRGDSERE